MQKPIVYTIGHSNHPIDYFLELLKKYSVSCIVDVRSFPASRYQPQYNQTPFKNVLKENNIGYLHLAKEFGGRQSDPDVLDREGRVNFELVRDTCLFKKGCERIRKGIEKGYVIALMCSEHNPIDCHRFSMISYALEKRGIEVRHILRDKTVKTNAELEDELLKIYKNQIPLHDSVFPARESDKTVKNM
jgi:uncharacterized protein (DUF488 family)